MTKEMQRDGGGLLLLRFVLRIERAKKQGNKLVILLGIFKNRTLSGHLLPIWYMLAFVKKRKSPLAQQGRTLTYVRSKEKQRLACFGNVFFFKPAKKGKNTRTGQ